VSLRRAVLVGPRVLKRGSKAIIVWIAGSKRTVTLQKRKKEGVDPADVRG